MSLNKYFRLPVSTTMYLIDTITLLAQVLVFPIENILYGAIQILLYSVILEKVLVMGDTKTELIIISPKYEEITKSILGDIDRGVTLLTGSGGYTRNPTEIIMSVVSNRQVTKIERLVLSIDPHALIIMCPVTEVTGHGFTLEKLYR